MDLSALSGLKKRVLQSVPSTPVEAVPAERASETVLEPEQQAVAGTQDARTAESATGGQSGADPESAADDAIAAPERLEGQGAHEPAERAKPTVISPEKIQPAAEEHSGHVTLYLPKDLNRWLGEHHDSTDISYPGIVLNAISWAAGENRLGDIFAPKDSPIPANDIFGRAPAVSKHARGSIEPETRPLRFRRDHMRVIISLARTWTADNRNAFFVGVLTAYRNHQNMG
ncbi:hypothetical protein ACFRAU_11475 [Arthrobacter sp. NPDC056691]|uniref:hypothetical protein n=1 Tax=Arthrobacter sp. NPDC056691 TaxID=3345913 RepID=UPI003672D6EB